MPSRRCCVPGCTSRKGEGARRLYGFPRPAAVRALWLARLGALCPRLRALSPAQLLNKLVCRRHFEARFLLGERRLYQSCPTLFSDEEIRSGTPARPARVHVQQRDHDYAWYHTDHTYASRIIIAEENDPLATDTRLPSLPFGDYDDGITSDADHSDTEDLLVLSEPSTVPVGSSAVSKTDLHDNTNFEISKEQICGVCLNYGVAMSNMGTSGLDDIYDVLVRGEEEPGVSTEDSSSLVACYVCAAMLRKFNRFRTKALKAQEILERLQGNAPGVMIDREQLGLHDGSLRLHRLDSVEIEPSFHLEAPITFHRPIKEEPDIEMEGEESQECLGADVPEKQNLPQLPDTAKRKLAEKRTLDVARVKTGIKTNSDVEGMKPKKTRVKTEVERKSLKTSNLTPSRENKSRNTSDHGARGARPKHENDEECFQEQKRFKSAQDNIEGCTVEMVEQGSDKLSFFDEFFQS